MFEHVLICAYAFVPNCTTLNTFFVHFIFLFIMLDRFFLSTAGDILKFHFYMKEAPAEEQ